MNEELEKYAKALNCRPDEVLAKVKRMSQEDEERAAKLRAAAVSRANRGARIGLLIVGAAL